MPPGGKDKRLSAEQIGLLEQWVRQGAGWESHWAFEQPVRAPLPAVHDPHWPRSPIDEFVLARLEREELRPSPEADPATLARRVSLDLTGLPPTLEMVDQFLQDTAPDAYERLVDRLLQAPAYGERWARMWLDQARHADSKGYEKDLTRTIWRYRVWVIDAFNADLPYDRFTTLQLAGDLLPGGSPDQLLATALHRNTLTNDEGGTDDEGFRIAAVKDRVDTTVSRRWGPPTHKNVGTLETLRATPSVNGGELISEGPTTVPWCQQASKRLALSYLDRFRKPDGPKRAETRAKSTVLVKHAACQKMT